MHITDWTANNNLRAERVKSSRYHDLLPLEWRLVNNDCKTGVRPSADNCLTSVRQVADNCPPSIGKIRKDKISVDEHRGETPLSYAEQYESACEKYGKATLEDYLQRVEVYQQSSGKVYADKLATACLWIERDIASGKLKPEAEKSYDIDEITKFYESYKPTL